MPMPKVISAYNLMWHNLWEAATSQDDEFSIDFNDAKQAHRARQTLSSLRKLLRESDDETEKRLGQLYSAYELSIVKTAPTILTIRKRDLNLLSIINKRLDGWKPAEDELTETIRRTQEQKKDENNN